jgi:hypothetical protein
MSNDKGRDEVAAVVDHFLEPGEKIRAVLPFASIPKLRKGPREGIRQRYRRYRPIVLTDRRLFLLETSRTPHPRGVLAQFRLHDVEVVGPITPGRFRTQEVTLDLAGVGKVPFVTGRYETDDLAELVARLTPDAGTGH